MTFARAILAVLLLTAPAGAARRGEPSPADPGSAAVGHEAPLIALPPRSSHLPMPPSAALLTCTPLAYDSVTTTIGKDGGELRVGPHVLSIPRNSLKQAVTITAVVPASSSNRIRFQPREFLREASGSMRLTMSYANCDDGDSLATKQIAYLGGTNSGIKGELDSIDNAATKTVTAPLTARADYAITW